MSNSKHLYTEEEKRSAIDKIGGFTYQFYCFLYQLLTMERGDEVSFEKYDDAALDDGNLITLFQTKHTVKVGANRKVVELTDRAEDLWKALDVWRILIEGSEEENRMEEEKRKYIDEHEFVFVCNKRIDNNSFVKLCKALKDVGSTEKIDELLDAISQKGRSRTGENPSKYRTVQVMIDDLKRFGLKDEFLKKVSFESKTQEEIKNECIQYITDHVRFSEEDAIEVFDDFFAEAVKDLFDKADSGTPLTYTFQEQKKRFERVFQFHREEALDFHIAMEQYRKEFLDLVCIQQLILVHDFAATETGKVAKHASYFYSFKNRYYDLIENSKILDKEDQLFRTEALDFWEDEFRKVYEDLDEDASEEAILKKARQLLREVRNYKLTLSKKTLERPISNGAFYYFSDECLIGWHRDWRNFFNKKARKDGSNHQQ